MMAEVQVIQLGFGHLLLYRLKRSPLTALGLVIIVALLLMMILAPVLATGDPNKVDLPNRLNPPGPGHPFGTDEMGRDIYSRVLYGSRLSAGVGLTIVLIACSLGIVVGSFSGFLGGRVDLVVMRLMDMILAFPSLVLSMALAASLGPNLFNAMLAVSFVKIPVYVRLVRGQVLGIREKQYIKAARTFGATDWWMIWRHAIPNAISPVIVQATLGIGEAILIASALSFIGLGAQPPKPEWGAMVSVGRQFLLDQWWYATFPGLAIFVSTIGFNLFGDGIRDILDPRSKR